jgi:hypothetical protein
MCAAYGRLPRGALVLAPAVRFRGGALGFSTALAGSVCISLELVRLPSNMQS